MPALAILAAAVAVCAGLIGLAPSLAEGMVALLSPEAQQDPAAVETVYTLLIFGALLAFGMIGGAICGFNAARPGRRPALELPLGLMLGALGVAAAAAYAWIAGAVRLAPAPAPALLIAWGSALVLVQAAAEEVYFRGWLQRALAERWGASAAVPVAALAFAALHMAGGARQPVSVANIFLGGLLFGLLAVRGRGLAAAVGAHFAWNWSEDILLGLTPNPGVGSFGALADLELTGAPYWGGSEEGLNGSVAMTLTLLALIVPLALAARRRAVTAPRRVPDRSGPAPP